MCLLSVLVALGGCGDGQTDEQQVADLVNEYLGAVRDRDSEAFCDTLSARGQRVVRTVARGDLGSVDPQAGCAELTEQLFDTLEAARFDEFLNMKLEPSDVEVTDSGTGAWAQCESRGAFRAKKVDGRWLLDTPGCFD